MSLLPKLFSTTRGKDSPRLSSLHFISGIDIPTEESQSHGFAGFVGTLMLFIAFFAMAWASVDPTVNIRTVMAYSFIYLGGFTISLAFGFSLKKKLNMMREITGIFLGIVTGAMVLSVMYGLQYIGMTFATNESVAFSLLAPVAETMAFVVAPYHLFKWHFKKAHWTMMAIPSDIVFSMFHFFRYFSSPNVVFIDVIIIWITLVIGNTLFVYIYHITKNATAPMIAHLIVNLAANTQPVLEYLYTAIPLFILLFVVFAFAYYFVGEFIK